ncbi:hypothetical protein D3C76_717870 [compost metagenome]
MPGVGHLIAGQVTYEVRLADQLEQIADARRQASLMLGQACAVGCQARHRIGGQRRHALLGSTGLEQLGELLQALVDHRDVFIEIHQDAKHFLEVRIEVLQRVVELAGADDDDLDLQRNVLRRQGDGSKTAHLAQGRFHFQFARLQGALQRIPHERLAEHFIRFKDQEAAVGPVQRTRSQLPIGGVERALVGAVFDAAEQVVVGRMRLEHHRGTTTGGMPDHQARRVLLLQQLAGDSIGLAVVDQLLDHGLEQIHLHRLQVAAHRSVLGVFLRQRRQQWLQGQGNGFLVEMAQLIARFALPLRQAGELLVQALFEVGNILMEAFALGFRQLGELRLVQRLAFEHRGEGDVAAVAVQRDLFFQRQPLDHVQRLVVALVERSVDGAFFLLVGRVLEHRRKGRQQVVDQAVDVTDEGTGGARRQFQCARLARLIEIVDVDPVRRGLQALAFGLEVAFDEREPASAGLAHDEYVVTGAWHGHTELQGFDRTFLAKHTAKGLQIIGGREAELFSGKRTGQRFGR